MIDSQCGEEMNKQRNVLITITYNEMGIIIDTKAEEVEKLPSAQPEIVRCKDCKHRPFDSEDTQGFGVEFPDEKCPCQCDDGWYNWRPNNEWFCANAERRTDG